MSEDRRETKDIVPPALDLRRSRIGLLLAVASIALGLLALGSLTVFPSILIDESAYRTSANGRIDRIELQTAKNELSRTMLQGVAALGLGATAIVTWWRIRLSEFEVRTGAQGQLAERFSRALEHLGSDSPVVRIGGVFALERIAQQSSWDQVPIARLLVGFATERSHEADKAIRSGSVGDIEAAVAAVSRSEFRGTVTERLNLSGLYLPHVDLSWSLALDWANLAGATLTGARLAGAELRRVDLTGARLDGADLTNVTMPQCDLTNAEARQLHVVDADMRELRATGAQMPDCFFGDVILYESHFDGTNLDGAKLLGVDLSDSNFSQASLRGATIGNCWLSGVDFSSANLEDVTWEAGDGTPNAWDPASPPRLPNGHEEPSSTDEFWGHGPPPRDPR